MFSIGRNLSHLITKDPMIGRIPLSIDQLTLVLVKLARDLTRPISPKWWFSEGNPLISGKSRLVKYYNLPSLVICCV